MDEVSFGYRVAAFSETTQIDLIGPGEALLDSVYYSGVPSVAITAPSDGQAVPLQAEATVRVEWTGSDADGDSLLYAILYSPNGGQTWLTLSLEQTETAFDVPVDPESSAHRVKVIATDGT
ncbi:MAG: hypothetical protein IIC50_18940 [Planctomycetes bacterium]|nr:hypothetical protein [Planctomycetota bacterium]